ncbi:GNAT family N-acetyltransferase [Haloglomus litoreum]|uniref:GNAT family N-acetyltransferase n=1 Tax=Haloglomus litoreum TaxID=3034026 RepID=UPI0023E8B146|nr:GNAT family protein [Haloglomus sp. DT116]
MPGAVFLADESGDLTLRTIEESDVPQLTEWANDPELRRATGEQATPSSESFERSYWLGRGDDPDCASLLVCSGDEAVGLVELDGIDGTNGVAELGVLLDREVRGSGLADRGMSLLLTHAFEELRLHRITGEVYADNDRSRRLLERLGFTHEGTRREDAFSGGSYRDTAVYGLLATEWSTDGPD